MTDLPTTDHLDATSPHPQLTVAAGDMPDWTDDRADRPLPGGAVLARLLDVTTGPATRALVAGPHSAGLVDLVVDRAAHTTLLLRGHTDAIAASERYAGRAVTVICGDLAACPATDVDLLVALDGLGRLGSVNAAERSWAAAFDLLRATLAPGATVLLSVDNPVSLSRLSGAGRPEADDTDSAWWPYADSDASAPGSADQARALLPGCEVWSARADLRQPSLVARSGTRVGVPLEVAAHPPGTGRDDLRQAAADLAAQGRTDELAAGWILVTGTAAQAAPDGLVAHGGGRLVVDLTSDGDVASRGSAYEHAPAPTGWRLDAGTALGPFPHGRLLETSLLEAAVRRDQIAVRALVRSWADALRGAGADLGVWASATADNVVVTETGDLAVLDPTLRREDAAEWTGLLVEHLADFSTRLSDLGWRHPWPAAAGTDEVTVLIAAMAGIEISVADARAAAVAAATTRSSCGRASKAPSVPPELARARAENDALRAKVSWFENAVRQRETMISDLRSRLDDARPQLSRRTRELEDEVAALRGSASFRVGRAVTAPVRRIRRRR